MAPVPETQLTGRLSHYLSSIHETLARASKTTTFKLSKRIASPVSGATPAANIPNNAIFALFGLIGAGFVITSIWFFFWAKGGGFQFKEGDWEDYKSTVLRRKGPNGTTLSGGTRSTDLGGGSVVGKKGRRARYKDVGDFESSIGTASEMSEIKAGRGGKKARNGKKSKKSSKEKYTDEGDTNTVVSEDRHTEDVVRAYRHEKPARVGGLNRVPDSSAFDGSTQDGSSHDAQSDLLSNRQSTPTSTPKKARAARNDNLTGGSGTPGIRKVQPSGSSTLWGTTTSKRDKERGDKERDDHIKSEAKKLQEKGRAASSAGGRREFSYSHGDDASTVVSSEISVDDERRARRERRQSRSPEKRVPGSWNGSEAGSADTGTKAYRHHIPGLSSNQSDYAEERRQKRAQGRSRRTDAE